MDELKLCPFCGKKGGCGAETASYGIAEKAIEAWNSRVDND